MDAPKHRRSDLASLPYVPDETETRVVTVRMPRSLHAELRLAAEREGTSLNLVCLSKLIAPVELCPIIPFGSTFRRQAFAEWRDREVVVRRCRVCLCTEQDCRSCIERTGEPCHWVEWDLCSACIGAATAFKPRTVT